MDPVDPPTLEEELEMEKAIRDALTIDDIDELRRCIEAILRQNHQQGIFISRCMDKIHYLYAKIACIENRVEQPDRKGLFKFLSTFFDPKI
tara:strand:+ start:116 stop:388 length:273 start_codon:yes stop_codon:yes gene_type:complete